MMIVAILTVRRNQLDTFRTFERHAVAVMGRHGGALERSVVVEEPEREDSFKEIHVIRFPDRVAWEAYRADPELAARAAERDRAVLATEVFVGHEGPSYV